MDELRAVLEACFINPAATLGRIERNCEVKILFLTLWELGWDPASQLLLDFQVDKEAIGEGTYMRVAPDIIIRDGAGILMVGDAKHWGKNLNNYFDQVRRYQRALGVTRGFLTNGHRWVIFGDDNGNVIFDKDFSDSGEMISALKHWIGPGCINRSGVLVYDKLLEKGLSLHKDSGPIDVASKWNPKNYTNRKTQIFLTLLNQLVDENSDLLSRGAKKNIFIRCNGGKLIEYSPETNTIAATESDHLRKLLVPGNLSKDYHQLVRKNKGVAAEPEKLMEKLNVIIRGVARRLNIHFRAADMGKENCKKCRA